MKDLKALTNYFHGKNQEVAFLDGMRIAMTGDPELKRLLKQKQQLETEFKALAQKHKLAMEEIEDKIVARRAAVKQEKQTKKADPDHNSPRGA